MDLAFAKPEESGWRGRGAPRREVPPHILEVLERIGKSGEVGKLDVKGDSADDIKQVVMALRAGGRQLGRRLRIQQDLVNHEIRFRMGDPL